MSLTFYYAPMSTATVTELALEELGIPVERVKLDLQKGDTKKPEYTKWNPNAKVPMIVHDGVAIWESAAIAIYLGETFGTEKKLWPAPGPKRGVEGHMAEEVKRIGIGLPGGSRQFGEVNAPLL